MGYRPRGTVTFVVALFQRHTLLFLEFEKQAGSWRISRLEWDLRLTR